MDPPPKYPVFGTAIVPSLNLVGAAAGADPGIAAGNAFALALPAARAERATLKFAPGIAVAVSDA